MMFELTEDQRRLAHLIDYSNEFEPLEWRHEGPITICTADQSFVVTGVANWSIDGGRADLSVDEATAAKLITGGAFGAFGTYGKFTTFSDMLEAHDGSGSWRLTGAQAMRRRSTLGATPSEVLGVDFRGLELSNVGADVSVQYTSHALVFAGVGLEDYPTAFPRTDRGGISNDGMVTNVFGRPALVRRLGRSRSGGDLVLVAHDGAILSGEERRALLNVLSVLAGHCGSILANITLGEGKELWRGLFPRADSRAHYRPLIRLHPGNRESGSLPMQFTSMLNEALQLANEGILLDVALHHLFADHRDSLDVEIRDIILALDSLVESAAFASGGDTIMESKAYRSILDSLIPEVDRVLGEHGAGPALREHIHARLKGANDISHSERRRRFWRRVGFDLKPDEKKALDYRHPMSHRGYVLRGADDREFQSLHAYTALARTLTNRVVLSLLKYEGPVFDYSTRRSEPLQYFIDRSPDG